MASKVVITNGDTVVIVQPPPFATFHPARQAGTVKCLQLGRISQQAGLVNRRINRGVRVVWVVVISPSSRQVLLVVPRINLGRDDELSDVIDAGGTLRPLTGGSQGRKQ